MKKTLRILLSVLLVGMYGCSSNSAAVSVSEKEEPEETAEPTPTPTPEPVKHASVLYQGHASLRVTTPEEKIIYIDPYMGEGYDEKADLILITHDHYDHVKTDLITERSDDCEIITYKEALSDGTYNTFNTKDVTVEAVSAGNNKNHNINVCVGYILTFSDGMKLYVSGDTSETDEMSTMASRNIDYMFISCDGIYNMNAKEASECADLIQAAHSIPYHTKPDQLYDETIAQQFICDSAMYVKPQEIIELN